MRNTGKSSQSTCGHKLSFERVRLDRLAPLPALFDGRVTPGKTALPLIEPVIACRSRNGLLVIDGCKRIALLKKQGKESAVCGIIRKSMPLEKAGLLRIRLNAGRLLHPLEKLLFIGWLRSHFNKKEYRKHAENLNVPANELYEYEKLLGCGPWLIEAVMRGVLDRTVAPEMNYLSQEHAGALITLFSTLAFSRSMQRELAEWLPEIAFIRKTGLPELLRSGRFAELLADTRLNDPQKTAGLHELARELRFPLYSEVRKTWNERARRVNPDPSKVVIQASPFFEKNSIEIRIKADEPQELHEMLQKLASVHLNEWQHVIDPCAGIVPPIPEAS